MNLPSVKTLKEITSYPRELRKVLELWTVEECLKLINSDKPFKRSEFDEFKGTRSWVHSCYHMPKVDALIMSMADELCGTYGVEYIEGNGEKSPSFEYLNAGDTYATTLLLIDGRFKVGCWGDIVERGNYE
jgi:hypothetical protein